MSALPQGDIRLLETEVAQGLLGSTIPARMAYLGSDGTPRVVGTWFHWNREELVMPTFLAAPHVPRPAARLRALQRNPNVAITIDTEQFPPHVLQLRGQVTITEIEGLAAEYVAAAHHYMGEPTATEYLAQIDQPGTRMARIALRPTWVGVLDFESRMPGVMAGQQS
jgi:hypothetical protein